MTGEPPPALRVTNLAVRFGSTPGFAELSLTVAPGERLVVVGASGAGKTTLLRAVAGLAPVESGRVEVAGRDVTRLPPERRDLVYLHQTPVLFPHLNVFENVAFALRVRRVPEPLVRDRVAQLLTAVRLAGFEQRAPKTLSGGQRHRVALARAVAARPAVLLLDEPLSSLDPALRDEVREAIVAVQQEAMAPGTPTALVAVTHDFDDAGLLADRIAVLVDRRIAQVAPPAELFLRPASLAVARFLGVANEVAGVVTPQGGFESVLGSLALGSMAGGRHAPGPAVAVFHAGALRAVAARAAEAQARARVVSLRHRAQRTTAVVRAGETQLEVVVDPVDPPVAGEEIGLVVDARALVLFAAGDPTVRDA